MGCLRKTNHIIETFHMPNFILCKYGWTHATMSKLEMGGKNKTSYKCFNEDQNSYNDTTAPCKSILPWVEQFEARSSIKRGTWCKLPSVPPVEVSYEAGVHLALNSVKREANRSPSLDLWCMNCCTTPESPCIHNLMWEITFRRRPHGTSKTSWSYATQYGWGQWLSEEQYFI